MSKFYEIIYETGNYSVACYENDDEALQAISEHHRRAVSGEPAQATNSQMGPAERIVKVLKYDEHPANFLESQAVPVGDVTSAVEEAISKFKVGDLVSVPEIAGAVREMTSPLIEDSAPHESNYKMDSVDELSSEKWDTDKRTL